MPTQFVVPDMELESGLLHNQHQQSRYPRECDVFQDSLGALAEDAEFPVLQFQALRGYTLSPCKQAFDIINTVPAAPVGVEVSRMNNKAAGFASAKHHESRHTTSLRI